MAIQFTPVTLDEMTTFLKRAFRSLQPKVGSERGETIIDLLVLPEVGAGIRVWTSIQAGGNHGAGVGDDAIRVQLHYVTSSLWYTWSERTSDPASPSFRHASPA
jgi:hypothetical protein